MYECNIWCGNIKGWRSDCGWLVGLTQRSLIRKWQWLSCRSSCSRRDKRCSLQKELYQWNISSSPRARTLTVPPHVHTSFVALFTVFPPRVTFANSRLAATTNSSIVIITIISPRKIFCCALTGPVIDLSIIITLVFICFKNIVEKSTRP